MKKSLAMAAFALTVAMASGPAMAQDGVYDVSGRTADGKTVSTSMLVSMSHRPKSEVQSILDKTFADVASRHSAAEFESTSMLYSNQAKEPLVQDMKSTLAAVDREYSIIAHSPLLPVRHRDIR